MDYVNLVVLIAQIKIAKIFAIITIVIGQRFFAGRKFYPLTNQVKCILIAFQLFTALMLPRLA